MTDTKGKATEQQEQKPQKNDAARQRIMKKFRKDRDFWKNVEKARALDMVGSHTVSQEIKNFAQENDLQLRFVNEENIERRQEQGYTILEKTDINPNPEDAPKSTGQRIEAVANRSTGQKSILMAIPKDIRDELNRRKRAAVAKQREAAVQPSTNPEDKQYKVRE